MSGILFVNINEIIEHAIDKLISESIQHCKTSLTVVIYNVEETSIMKYPLVKVLSYLYNTGTLCYLGIHGCPLYDFTILFYPLSYTGVREVVSRANTFLYKGRLENHPFIEWFTEEARSKLNMISIEFVSDEASNKMSLSLENKSDFINDYVHTQYHTIVLGGTFDHLHSGHKLLLSVATLYTTESLICGVSDRDLLKDKAYPSLMESIGIRSYNVKTFVNRINSHLMVTTTPITDPFGPSTTNPRIDAIVVSQETIHGAELINIKRQQNELRPLDVVIISLLNSQTMKSKLSSTEIRKWICNHLTIARANIERDLQ